ncbi:hypothetical protein PIB30_115317, partial [Stylosanthes scabra]|nr:hypothetical protein [Stylosanthes scabra]
MKNAGKNKDGAGPSENAGIGRAGDVGAAAKKYYQPQFNAAVEELVYEYEEEALGTPVSSDEEHVKHDWPEFNDEYAFGEGHFELGTRFATLDKFREVVKDMFIAE